MTVIMRLSLLACALYAPATMAQQLIDPALLNSEPVEESPDTSTQSTQKTTDASPSVDPTSPFFDNAQTDFPIAKLQGLNKVTAKTILIEVPMNVTVMFGTLAITPQKCWKAPPDRRPENAVLLEVVDNKGAESSAPVFSGWMFSSSPAISALEHPVYDITMLDCAAD